MTIRASVFIAISLDGFIARLDGSLDWLTDPLPTENAAAGASPAEASSKADAEDYGYGEFIATVDAIVMGKNTFLKVLTFPDWPYPDQRVIVLSTTLTAEGIPEILRDKVELRSEPVGELGQSLANTGCRHLYVDGGQVIQSFLQAGLIDQITLTQIPILIGTGIPLFGPLPQDCRLRHLKTRSFATGFVQTTYQVMR
ncbi:MAG: dihydrofolate reductase [Synechococcaceae cyanobacterium SM2_3_2]|nr:dihydrofolate reductase [Synechococcaceae cyanobacterium SM2_3_2]